MKRKSIRPGRLFWVWSFMVGVFSPGRGKRRVNDKMIWVDTQWLVSQARVKALEEELATAYRELERRPAEEPLKKCVGEIAACLVHGDREETVPLPTVDLGVIRVHRLLGAVEATSLPGMGMAPNGG